MSTQESKTAAVVPKNAQEAAIQLSHAMRGFRPHGLNAELQLADGSTIITVGNALNYAAALGILDGMAQGHVICGDARINSSVGAAFNDLQRALADWKNKTTEGEEAEKERAKYVVQQLHQIAKISAPPIIRPTNLV